MNMNYGLDIRGPHRVNCNNFIVPEQSIAQHYQVKAFIQTLNISKLNDQPLLYFVMSCQLGNVSILTRHRDIFRSNQQIG